MTFAASPDESTPYLRLDVGQAVEELRDSPTAVSNLKTLYYTRMPLIPDNRIEYTGYAHPFLRPYAH